MKGVTQKKPIKQVIYVPSGKKSSCLFEIRKEIATYTRQNGFETCEKGTGSPMRYDNVQKIAHILTYLTCPMRYYFRYIEHAEVERTSISIP